MAGTGVQGTGVEGTGGSSSTAGGGEGGEEFVHAASGVRLGTHPLIHAFRRLTQGEMRRKRGSRYATLSCHEWIRLAAPAAVPRGGGGARGGGGRAASGPDAPPPPPPPPPPLQPMWVNLMTGQRCAEFPTLVPPQDGVFTRANGWAEAKER